MEILSWLNKPFIIDFDVEEYRQVEEITFIKLSIVFIDNSILFVKEFTNANQRKYAFHWQDSLGILRVRWDNAPHHHHLSGFPHHKHIGSPEKVADSFDISIHEVMQEIEAYFS